MRGFSALQPTELQRSDPVAELKRHLRGKAEVREPQEADEPILGTGVRSALLAWLAEIRGSDALAGVGLKPRNTALFYGPPGCGKTTMAHHLAARLGVPMVLVGPENIISSGWGEAERSLSGLFDALESVDIPCVLFLDEAESLGGKRDKNTGGSADNARTSLLGVLLRRIESYSGFAVAATNRHEDIDPALWRRFDLQIPIDLPAHDERFAILKRYGAPFDWADDDLDLIADLTSGASPALLRGVMEGVKRALVLGTRAGWDLSAAPAVFERVLLATQPPPEIEPPEMWRDRAARARLDALAWPPVRGAA